MYNLLYLVAIAAVVIGLQFVARYYRMRRLGHWLKRGTEAYGAQRYDEALPAFRKCVAIAPEWVHTRALLGMSLAQTGKREEALREIEMVRALQPEQAETWALISLFYALCMPENNETLMDALETLCSLDAAVADKIINKPQFRRYARLERFQELQQRIKAANAAEA